MLKRRIRLEFDSVSDTPDHIEPNPFWGGPFIVKLRVYNRGLFSLKGEITSTLGERTAGACLGPEPSEPVAINLPGKISRLRKIFRNPAKDQGLELDFFILEIVTSSTPDLLILDIFKTFGSDDEKFWLPLTRRQRFKLTPPKRETVWFDESEGIALLMPHTIEEVRKLLKRLSNL